MPSIFYFRENASKTRDKVPSRLIGWRSVGDPCGLRELVVTYTTKILESYKTARHAPCKLRNNRRIRSR